MPAETVGTVNEAMLGCKKQGARLFEVRSSEAINYFKDSESFHLGSQGLHMYVAEKSHISIGLTYQVKSPIDGNPKLFYR